MMILLAIFLLVAAGAFVAYSLSPATGARRRANKAIVPLRAIDSELHTQYQRVESSLTQAAESYIQEVRTQRLRNIPLDELKRHGSGIRLQALKDAGVRTLADLQGWSEMRLSQVRGVGPKSASTIVYTVRALSSASNALAIPRPTPPFASERERALLQAAYLNNWIGTHLSKRRKAFDETLSALEDQMLNVRKATTFMRWIWGFGVNSTVKSGIDSAEHIYRDIEESGSTRSLLWDITANLTEFRALCSGRIEIAVITSEYEANRYLYDSLLDKTIGHPVRMEQSPKADGESMPIAAKSIPSPLLSSTVGDDASTTVTQGLPQSSLPRNNVDEVLVSFTIGGNTHSTPREFSLPASKQPARSNGVKWLPKGNSITVQGRSISLGFLYYGRPDSGAEQCAVDPTLAANSNTEYPPEIGNYYYSYEALTPEQRGRYLTWLALGALTPEEPGFGILYFAGLERRVLLLTADVEKPYGPEEQGELQREIARLAEVFVGSLGSVTNHCTQILDFLKTRAFDGSSIPELPSLWERGYVLPPSFTYGVGLFMKEKKPIPVEWAIRWAYVEPNIYLRTPATRCAREFEAAFTHIYTQRFGEGLVVQANKTILKISYQPMSYSLSSAVTECKFSGIPDIRALTVPQQTLKEIVDQSTAMVDGYSRFIGRNPRKTGTLEAYLTLPFDLWPEDAKLRIQEIQSTLAKDMRPIQYVALLKEFGCDEELSSNKSLEFVKALTKVSLGVEPDILSGARRPRPSEPVVVFMLSTFDDNDRLAPEYQKASLTIGVAATVALADGQASDSEADAVNQMIARWTHLHPDQRNRLRAQYQLLVNQPSSLASLKMRMAKLAREDRVELALAVASLASADGVVSPEEVRLLEQIYRVLELESNILYSHLHGSGNLQQLREDAGPTTGPSSFLNANRIAELRRQTDAVTELLAGVFAEHEEEISVQKPVVLCGPGGPMSDEIPMLPGLDVIHNSFLSLLITKAVWTKSDLISAAAERRIMLDGALERINDAALDFAGEVLIEGDDPIYVQQNIMESTG